MHHSDFIDSPLELPPEPLRDCCLDDIPTSPANGKRRGSSNRTSKRFRRDTSGLTLLTEKVLGKDDIGVDPMVKEKILKAPQFHIGSRGPKETFFLWITVPRPGRETSVRYFPRDEIRFLTRACYIYLAHDLNHHILLSKTNIKVLQL